MKSMTKEQFNKWKWLRALNRINPFRTVGIHPIVKPPVRRIRIKSIHEIND